MVGKKNELDARGCQKNFQEIHLALVTNVFLRRETDIKFVVWTTRRTAWFKYLSARVNFPHTHCLESRGEDKSVLGNSPMDEFR